MEVVLRDFSKESKFRTWDMRHFVPFEQFFLFSNIFYKKNEYQKS